MAKGVMKGSKTAPDGAVKNRNGGVEVNEAIINIICERLCGGLDMVQVCDMPDMPSRTAVHHACKANPEWQAKIDATKPLRAERHVRKGFDILEDAVKGKVDPSAADKLASMHRWAATKIDGKNWGDKVSQEVSGVDGGALSQSLVVEFVSANKNTDS